MHLVNTVALEKGTVRRVGQSWGISPQLLTCDENPTADSCQTVCVSTPPHKWVLSGQALWMPV